MPNDNAHLAEHLVRQPPLSFAFARLLRITSSAWVNDINDIVPIKASLHFQAMINRNRIQIALAHHW